MTMLQRNDRRTTEPAAGLPPRSSRLLPVAAGIAWVLFVGLALAVQPPTDPAAPVDAASMILSTFLWMSALAAITGLLAGERWGHAATAAGGVFLVGTVIACYAGGHTGAWLLTQALCGVGLTTVGMITWRAAARA
jgi:hypothetical protein